MSEFRKAPDGQPTSNIKTMLDYAKQEYYEWEHRSHELQGALERAEKMMAYWDKRELELEYQLAQRKLEDHTN